MKNRYSIVIMLIISLFIASCETDFDQNAEWKEVMVVYGLLNQTDSISYIKVNKAFLGDGSAIVYAQEPDSNLYGNDIEVRMEQWRDGSMVKEFVFDTTTLYNKDSGLFYYPQQPLYQCVTYQELDDESEYKLFIRNKKSGLEVMSNSPLVHDFTVLKPAYNHPTLPTISFPDNNSAKDITWYSAVNGRRYEILLRFNFYEKFYDKPDTLSRSVEMRFPTRRSEDINGGDEMEVKLANDDFYINLQNMIPYDAAKEDNVDIRIPGKIEILFSVAAEEFNLYMEVNEPSNSIVQDRPEYTNIENGLGLFSSRYNKVRTYYLHPLSQEILVTKGMKFIEVVIAK